MIKIRKHIKKDYLSELRKKPRKQSFPPGILTDRRVSSIQNFFLLVFLPVETSSLLTPHPGSLLFALVLSIVWSVMLRRTVVVVVLLGNWWWLFFPVIWIWVPALGVVYHGRILTVLHVSGHLLLHSALFLSLFFLLSLSFPFALSLSLSLLFPLHLIEFPLFLS